MFFVRIAKSGDAPKIARIRVNALLVADRGQGLKARTIKRREAFWRGRLAQARGSVFVIETDEIIGFGDLVPVREKGAKEFGEIAAIYALPDYWKQGAGRVLVSYVLDDARKRRYKAVTVWVLASNSDAMRFFESMRFVRDGAFKIETASDGSNLHELRYRVTL